MHRYQVLLVQCSCRLKRTIEFTTPDSLRDTRHPTEAHVPPAHHFVGFRPMLTDIRDCKTNHNFGSVCRIPDAYDEFCTIKTSAPFVTSTNGATFCKPATLGLQLKMLQTMNYKPFKSRKIGAAPRFFRRRGYQCISLHFKKKKTLQSPQQR